jgi:hypothetical protein
VGWIAVYVLASIPTANQNAPAAAVMVSGVSSFLLFYYLCRQAKGT